jgi:hypothetical protein
MSDLYDAVTQGEGYIVIVDKPTSREIAHPPYCPGVQSEHFHEKVVVNKGKSGGYYLVSTMSEAREAFNAVPCSCARCRRGHGVNSDGGISEANTAALKRELAAFPDATLQTQEEFKDAQVATLTQVLNVLYVLLALSVIVSLFGLVNTLVLRSSSGRASSGCCALSA